MENLSRGRAAHLSALGALGAWVALVAAPAAAGDPDLDVALVGAWHVLVHYKDDNANHPERQRWDDRVWIFEESGSRLRWTEYPIVVFDDGSGRFERRGTGQYARILHFWEPNESQLSDIRDGLQVNERGSKSKTLRRSDGGWASFSRSRPVSASVVTYTENWSIEPGPEGPIFRREDVLGSAMTESLDGVTLYTTEAVEADGAVLRGTFVRDGTRHGSFRMMRSGGTEALKSDGRSPNQKVRDAAIEAFEGLDDGGD